MVMEVERKYLVLELQGVTLGEGLEIDQGYLASVPLTVRVRTKGSHAFLTIKGPSTLAGGGGGALSRPEFEYEIPVTDAQALLELATARLQKIRHTLPGGVEIDIFHGRHGGLILAEFESPDGAQPAPIPGIRWIEVTADPRYSNSWIAKNGIPE